MSKSNYEALGIYTEAKEQYKEAKGIRADKANELQRELRELGDTLNQNPKRLDIATIEKLTRELKSADDEMTLWMDKANAVCDECGKMPLEFRRF